MTWPARSTSGSAGRKGFTSGPTSDKETTWDTLAQVVAMLGQAGFQVNMVTQPEDMGASGRK
jgi:hypothetical protein